MDLVMASPPVAEVEIPATLGQLDGKVERGREGVGGGYLHPLMAGHLDIHAEYRSLGAAGQEEVKRTPLPSGWWAGS